MSVRGKGFKEYIRLSRALEIVESNVDELDSEEISFEESYDRVIAEEVRSKMAVPPFDRAAMDGFAVRAEDTFGAKEENPVELEVSGSIEIGGWKEIEVCEGKAVEIATGAPIPKGADSVVKIEDTIREGSRVRILSPVTPGRNVSAKGEDLKSDEAIFERGHRLKPADLGLLASTRNLEIKVMKRPKVGIVSTGNELKEPEEALGRGEVIEVNSYTIGSAVLSAGGIPVRLGIVPDKKEEINKALDKAPDFDFFILSGGTSVGKMDLVPDSVSEKGELLFHGVAIRPGGPSAFGIFEDTPVFSLAGFPAAALLAFEMLVGPALEWLQGVKERREKPSIEATLTRNLSSKLGRKDIARARLIKDEGCYFVEPVRVTGSSILRTIKEADGNIIVPEDRDGFSEGETVDFRFFRYCG